MPSFSPRTLIPALCLLCLPAFSQEPAVVHICVAVLRSGTNTISATEVRDQLVKALNEKKPDQKLHLSGVAVPLEDTWGTQARAEAQGKSCEFVLSTRLSDLQTSSAPAVNSAGPDSVPIFRATLEYQLIRTLDGTVLATESAKGEDPTSLREAVRDAVSHVASKTLPDIAKNGNAPAAETPVLKRPAAQTDAMTFSSNSCVWLPSDIPHADAVAGVCQYAMSLPQKMPNFICDQDASRYWGNNKVPFDLVTASLRYEDGRESYYEIKVNGRPASDDITKSPGLWSTGEFGSNLRSIFDTGNHAVFAFVRETAWKEHSAWVFSYTIAKQDDPLWRLSTGTETLAPAYKGELWVDRKTGELLRFGSVATDIPKTFPIADAVMQIDYADVPFADGSSFVLPADFTVISTLRGRPGTRNLVQFRNCHKFRAKTRMVLDVASVEPAEDSAPTPAERSAKLERELEDNNQIYTILRDRAVREDDARLALELRAAQYDATIEALRKLNALQREWQKNLTEQEASVNPPPPSSAAEGLTTLKIDVKLVPVSVVLRDGKGNAIGNLRKEDFQLFDDGKPQAITSFSLERAEPAASVNPGGKYPASPGAKFVQRSDDLGAPAAVRDVAYVFDDIHSAFGDLVQAREAAVRHISALREDDRAAIFSTSGEIATPFTTDREKLLQALKGLRQHPALRGSLCPPMTEYMADMIVNHGGSEALDLARQDALKCAFDGMASASDGMRAEQMARSAAFEVLNATSAANQNTLNVLYEVLRRTAAVPGNRSIVLVSPGFLTLTPETRQSVMELVDRAVRANIIVHTLDVRGLYTVGLAVNESHPSNSLARLGFDRDEAFAQSDVMAELAYGTGGTFFHNNNDVGEGFRRTADAPEYMYVLGFTPQKLDGKFHELKVKSNRPGLTLQARQGYYAAAH
jgi:VWFA-related protein